MTTQNTRIQLRRGTADALAAVNEILLAGEIGIETDTGRFKFGDGVTAWNSLAYSGLQIPSGEGTYVLKNGAYTPANVVDMTETWQPSIQDEEIVLAVDEDMTPYQLTGNNTEVNV